jgi:hypothetical protein
LSGRYRPSPNFYLGIPLQNHAVVNEFWKCNLTPTYNREKEKNFGKNDADIFTHRAFFEKLVLEIIKLFQVHI